MEFKIDIYLITFVVCLIGMFAYRYWKSSIDKEDDFVMIEYTMILIAEQIEYEKLASINANYKSVSLIKRIYGTLISCCGKHYEEVRESIEKTIIERVYIYTELLKNEDTNVIKQDNTEQVYYTYFEILYRLVEYFPTTRSLPEYLKMELIKVMHEDITPQYAYEIESSLSGNEA